MSAPIRTRLEALEMEASRADHNLHVVIAKTGETGDQALRGLGIDLIAQNVLVVAFWVNRGRVARRPPLSQIGHPISMRPSMNLSYSAAIEPTNAIASVTG